MSARSSSPQSVSTQSRQRTQGWSWLSTMRTACSPSDEGELRWHSIPDLATLDGLADPSHQPASHQLLFLDRVLLHDDGFYSGIAVCQNNKMVEYADSEKSLARR